ncbi:DMT family transporter [Oceanicella actignis]|uniref:Permease of the drug/metabolite transporter (DMT) superfamily n=1 Tax=Oceanicella actignis TaxID=1189325 RepID=A0A1M7SRN5_9RHOB|nr:DMT family transporter [Oceanicella actignis]SES67652.1 Permease of the drug/metabolite transporter (DMT) superfamily [Oceanicella actignis]SHN61036.1 Permease of the drug/metabolite transporter (DMT) superfamily [Oceanicella actignis]
MTHPRPAMRPEALGMLLMVAAVFAFSCMDAVAKGLAQRYDPLQVVWARYASQTVWAFVLLAPRLPQLLPTRRPMLHALRSVLLFGATACFFAAFAHMQLAEATAIFEIAPLLITALAFFILREHVGPRRWAGVAAGFCGALIIIRPGLEVFSPAALLPMAAALCFAGYSIATRWLSDDESPWTAFLYTGLFGALVSSLAMPFAWTTPSLADALVMSAFGLLGGAGHLAIIHALRRAEASVIAPLSYCGLVFNTLWGFAFYAEIPDLWTVVGALVIVGAGLYVWWRERRRAGA